MVVCRFSARAIERFRSKLRKNGECVEWTGCRSRKGYGGVGIRPFGRLLAHRVAWEIANGRSPVGVVRHVCDNPCCCNPEHLIEGTQKENIRDSIDRGRFVTPPRPKGEDHYNASLTNAQVHEIRRRRTAGEAMKTLASAFDVSDSLVGAITRGEAWMHLPFYANEKRFEEPGSKPVTIAGEVLTVAAWARKLGVKKSTLGRRLRKGWSTEKAILQPVRRWRRSEK